MSETEILKPPPSTLTEVAQALIAYGADRPRSQQVALGPSELGTPCRQQMARKIAGWPEQPERDAPWATLTGGAVHDLMEDVLKHWNKRLDGDRWLAEGEVSDGYEVSGHSDAYDAEHQMVVDWKYTDFQAKKLREAKRKGKPVREQISQDYRIQAHIYGYMQDRVGRPVKWVRIVFFGRTANLLRDSEEWTEEWNPDVAIWALDRYYSLVDEIGPDDTEREAKVLGVPIAPERHTCQWCPFFVPHIQPSRAGCPGITTTAAA
jgi:hypothetical protein